MGPELEDAWQTHARRFLMPRGPWPDLPARTLLEIGSGMGQSAVAAAPAFDLVIGVDVHRRGLAATIRSAHAEGIGNVRLVLGDAVAVLVDQVPVSSLAEVHIWFPDPWPKARHHKRRLIQMPFVDLLASRLVPGGLVRLATDMPDYARSMKAVFAATPAYRGLGDGGSVRRPSWRPVTRYERFGLDRGRPPIDLAFRRVSASP